MECSCPDWANMCKHVAAVLYGVGARLDRQPEMLFALRQVNHLDLIAQAGDVSTLTQGSQKAKVIAAGDLADVFGIELSPTAPTASAAEAKNPPGKVTDKATRIKPPKGKTGKSAIGKKRSEPVIPTRNGQAKKTPVQRPAKAQARAKTKVKAKAKAKTLVKRKQTKAVTASPRVDSRPR